MRLPILALALALASGASTSVIAEAQDLTPAERDAALLRVRQMADCVERQHAALGEISRLVREAERQRETSRDTRARQDAEAALEALIARAAAVQSRAESCFGGDPLPSPGTRTIVRGPPPDPAADAVAETGGTVREVESDAALSSTIRVERGEQVDGQGRVDPSQVRSAIRAVTPRIQRCYDQWLERGSISTRHLDLVFTFRGSGRASQVRVESSDFRDRRMDQCVQQAGAAIRVSGAPSGGHAIYSYRLRFGR